MAVVGIRRTLCHMLEGLAALQSCTTSAAAGPSRLSPVHSAVIPPLPTRSLHSVTFECFYISLNSALGSDLVHLLLDILWFLKLMNDIMLKLHFLNFATHRYEYN